MSDPITDAVTEALTAAAPPPDKGAAAPPPLPQPIPPHVAANIMEFMKRVQVTGIESYAFVEAFGHLQRFAAPPPGGAGVPFTGK